MNWSLKTAQLAFTLYIHFLNGRRFFETFYFLSISRGHGKKSRSENIERLNFDKLGRLPEVENAYNAVIHATPIACVRTSNSTIVAFKSQNISALNWSLFQPLTPIGNDNLFLLMTGLVGSLCIIPDITSFVNLKYCTY